MDYTTYMLTDRRGVFVFGSNLAGRHGKGAALDARHLYGAIYGQGTGLQGRAYAIPTKSEPHRTLPLERIWYYVEEFLNFADQNRELNFYVTRIGCGHAGYTDQEIAPMFKTCSPNVILPAGWLELAKV